MTRLTGLNRLYELLSRTAKIPGCSLQLADLSSTPRLPVRGVYFLFEPGEARPSGAPRVVRVGTHAVSNGSKTNLRTRLRGHLGAEHGAGNHRGSVFRLLVGEALLARGDARRADFPEWGHGSSAPPEVRRAESALERDVSAWMRELRVLVIPADDIPSPQSARADVERNSIALLSACTGSPDDPPSPGWLGRHSVRPEIRDSGLWNQRHVHDTPEPGFLERIEALIETAEHGSFGRR